jgi:hypothetical protein
VRGSGQAGAHLLLVDGGALAPPVVPNGVAPGRGDVLSHVHCSVASGVVLIGSDAVPPWNSSQACCRSLIGCQTVLLSKRRYAREPRIGGSVRLTRGDRKARLIDPAALSRCPASRSPIAQGNVRTCPADDAHLSGRAGSRDE